MSKNKTLEKCYKCNVDANSREHVPPRCLFPEQKDTAGINFRKDLITVPSCVVHNSQKSSDDEFLMASLSSWVGSNEVGFLHAHTKIRRAFENKKSSFTRLVMSNAEEVMYRSNNGILFPLIKGNPNITRLKVCFENIAYGLFLNEYKKRFKGDCRIFLGFLNYQNINLEKSKILCQEIFESKNLDWKIKGENPTVFKYQFGDLDSYGLIPLRMTFYENAEVYVTFKATDSPFNLLLELSEISTRFTLKSDLGDLDFDYDV